MNPFAAALIMLAIVQPGESRLKEDERVRRGELARVRKARGEGDAAVADAVIGLAWNLEAQGRTRAVEDLYRLEIDVSRKGADKSNTRVLSLAFAEWLLRMRRPAAAELIARGALDLGRQSLGAEDWRLSDNRSLIGETLRAQKKFSSAESLLIEAHKELSAAVAAPPEARKKTIRRLVDLYEAWERVSPGKGKMAEAARWKALL
ncbi:MAG: hypothetical protein K1Y01_18875 [Vicinamibacteria bacterium]|nr:hypothetical protein [Vicinamibacteria bacterium]